MSDGPVVLDASALLALLQNEPGADVVGTWLTNCVMSAVNLSEVVAKLVDNGVPDGELRVVLDGLDIEISPFDAGAAYEAGALRRSTRDAGLSLGDRACLALAVQLGVPAMTADRAWSRFAGDVCQIELIR